MILIMTNRFRNPARMSNIAELNNDQAVQSHGLDGLPARVY
ncbi:hypothetical protein S7335_349 [Synechococcus sp. PCC 7335]|nr:hypothetical protein S7335_349 [Synechococcus sp. PCC 7335]